MLAQLNMKPIGRILEITAKVILLPPLSLALFAADAYINALTIWVLFGWIGGYSESSFFWTWVGVMVVMATVGFVMAVIWRKEVWEFVRKNI